MSLYSSRQLPDEGNSRDPLDIWSRPGPGNRPSDPLIGSVGYALSRAREILAENDIEDPPLESIVLLTHALNLTRVQLYLELDKPISPAQAEQLGRVIQRRLKGEPTAYLVGRREFFGCDFYVNPDVLIPRPETELLVELALETAKQSPVATIADIGTGSGAIAISLALKLPEAKIYATDISAAALKVASANCEKHGVVDRVCLLQGDLLEPLPEPVDLIVANLPYVTDADLKKVNTFGFEPALALSGGRDGLGQIRRLCSQITGKLRPGGSLLLEIGQGQREAVTTLLRHLFPSGKVKAFTDLAGVGRVVGVTL